jgi:hypothetical protein
MNPCRCDQAAADSASMSHIAAPSGLDERPSVPIAPRWPQPSGRKNAHRGLAPCRRPASGETCSQALIASRKNRRLPTTARRTHLLQQTQQQDPCQSAGNAPDPQQFAADGAALAQQAANSPPSLVNGLDELSFIAQFHRGGLLDAQAQGANNNYGNFAFGAFFAGLGWSLQDALAGANAYGAMFSQYSARQLKGHYPSYPAIPAANVQYIMKGYSAAKAGVLCHKPQ